MSMLAAPDMIIGLLRAEDLDRDTSPGNVWLLPRRVSGMQCPPCTGNCRQGRDCPGPDTIPTDYGAPGWLDSCAPEGGKHAEPVPSAQKKRDVNGARIGFVLLLLSATTVVGVIVGAIYARWPIAWPLG